MSARQAYADDAGFSFTVCRSSALREGNDARQTMTFVPWSAERRVGAMCRGSAVKKRFGAFNLRV
jgi:hypothetical protein